MYSPFNKDIADIVMSDVHDLVTNGVQEGHFIEYKQEPPSNQKISNSIASFANSDGGWYVVGVVADHEGLATSAPGFTPAERGDEGGRIRNIVRDRIDPIPVIHHRTLKLEESKSLVVVQIPPNQAGPFVTKEGRIYRRNSDASDPVPESRRDAIDRLVDRGRRIRQQFEDFCVDERTFAQAEDGSCWFTISVSPHPHDPELLYLDPGADGTLRSILDLSREPHEILPGPDGSPGATASFSFLHAWPTNRSVVLSNKAIKPTYNADMVELFADGRARFHMLAPMYNNLDQLLATEGVDSEPTRELLAGLPNRERMYRRPLLLGKLSLTLATALAFYRSWIATREAIEELDVGVTVRGAWRAIPYLDHDDWASHVSEFGLPVSLRDEYSIPSDLSRPIRLPNETVSWMLLAQVISRAFGLPDQLYTRALIGELNQWQQTSSDQSSSAYIPLD